MKKIFVLLLIAACVLGCTGCFCGHQWVEASCLEPQSCPLCGKVEGEALGHVWHSATCQAPKTCASCGETQGETVDHQWEEATCLAPRTCRWCELTESVALEHTWQKATTETPQTCAACGSTEGERIVTDERFTTADNQALFGNWETEFLLSGEELNVGDYVEEVAFIATVGFEEDGSLKVTVRFRDLEAFAADLVAVTEEMIYLQFEGMEIAREDADVMFADVYGMTVAEYAAGVWAEADWNAMLEIYAKHYVYYVENGKLNIGRNWESAFESCGYALADDRLTITESNGTVLELTRAELPEE